MLTKLLFLTVVWLPLSAFADQALLEKLIAKGVPARVERVLEFREKHMGADFIQDVYYCHGRPSTDSEACPRKSRINTTRTVKLTPHDYIVYIDMKQRSTEPRFYVINIHDRENPIVWTTRVAHGKNSGEGPFGNKFSNIRDSKQTSLGIYIVGPVYHMGGHGPSLRLYGVERSNSNAYLRDIVFHGAAYTEDNWLAKKTEFLDIFGLWTKKLGESWGCPAVPRETAKKLVPVLKDGALLYIDHEDVMDEALTGNPVVAMRKVPLPRPRPEQAPKRIEFQVVKEKYPSSIDLEGVKTAEPAAQ